MFIWQRALGLSYYRKCFATGNALPSYIFISTTSNAKKKGSSNKAAGIHLQQCFTPDSSKLLIHKPKKWGIPCSVFLLLVALHSSCQWDSMALKHRQQEMRSDLWLWKMQKRKHVLDEGRKLFSFLTTLSHSDLWEAETEALTGEKTMTSVLWPD